MSLPGACINRQCSFFLHSDNCAGLGPSSCVICPAQYDVRVVNTRLIHPVNILPSQILKSCQPSMRQVQMAPGSPQHFPCSVYTFFSSHVQLKKSFTTSLQIILHKFKIIKLAHKLKFRSHQISTDKKKVHFLSMNSPGKFIFYAKTIVWSKINPELLKKSILHLTREKRLWATCSTKK